MATTSTAFNNEVLRLTNQFRAENGLKALKFNAELNETAQGHSQDMALKDFFSHTGKNGSKAWDRARSNGYTARSMGENIAAGQRTPESVVNAWINSPGHRKNLLNSSYTEMGVGYFNLSNDTGKINYTTYWTQVFGSGDLTPDSPAASPKPKTTPKPKPAANLGVSPIAHLQFDDGRGTRAKDTSAKGVNNFGKLVGGANWTEGKSGKAINLDGKNDKVMLRNSKDLNRGTHAKRTVSMWFKVDDVGANRKQVVYEEGGGLRGLNAYVKDDLLYFGGWNTPESKWSGSWKSTNKVSSGKWHHMALVLDGQSQVQKDSLIAYLDGNKVAQMDASQLWNHAGVSLGNVSGATRFHDGVSRSGQSYGLDGAVDDLKIFNNALTGTQVNKLADFM